jgi:hypothetical protein
LRSIKKQTDQGDQVHKISFSHTDRAKDKEQV